MGPAPSLGRWLPWLVLAALAVAVVASAGWDNGTSAQRGPVPTPGVPSGGPGRVSIRTAVAVVERTDLVRTDVPGFGEVPARAGDDLDPGDRLHVCGEAVPRERDRLAGHRRAFHAADGRRVRTEVAYYGPGGADRELDALRRSAPTCSVPVRTGRTELPSTLALWVRLTDDRGPGRREVVALRSGDVLVVLEVDRAGFDETLRLTRTLAARLG